MKPRAKMLLQGLREFIGEHSDGITEPSRGHDGNSISKWARQELLDRLDRLEEEETPTHLTDGDLEKLAFSSLTREELAQIATDTVSGNVEDSELNRVEEHLLTCGSCVDRAKGTITIMRAMRDAAREIRGLES